MSLGRDGSEGRRAEEGHRGWGLFEFWDSFPPHLHCFVWRGGDGCRPLLCSPVPNRDVTDSFRTVNSRLGLTRSKIIDFHLHDDKGSSPLFSRSVVLCQISLLTYFYFGKVRAWGASRLGEVTCDFICRILLDDLLRHRYRGHCSHRPRSRQVDPTAPWPCSPPTPSSQSLLSVLHTGNKTYMMRQRLR